MQIEFQLEEKDFLVHQLYLASKSVRIKKKRIRNRLVVSFLYIFLGIFLFLFGDILAAIAFCVLALLWFFIYPIWEKHRYMKHFREYISENYKDQIGKTVTIDFRNDYLLARDTGSESKILTSELAEIDEIATTIFIRLKGNQSFILPKEKIENIDNVITELEKLSANIKINYIKDEQWKWR